MGIPIVQKQRDEDPLDKLAKAVGIAKAVYGIHVDSKTLDQVMAKKAEEDKLRGLQIKEAERKESAAQADEATTGPLIDTIRAQAGKRGLKIPEGMTVGQARTNFDAFLKPSEPKQRDPLLDEMRRLDLEKKRNEMAGKDKNAKVFGNRYKNIKSQITALKGMIDDKGTYEVLGPHNKTMQQKIDSIAIDAAKLFDPESVARESEVAAFKNMLFEGGTLSESNETAKALLDRFSEMMDTRAANEGLADLIPSEADAPPGDGQVPADIKAAAAAELERRRKDARK